MGIKNYTSQQPVMRTIALIEVKLAVSGATQILKEYTPDGKVDSIAFIKRMNGFDMPFKLPAKISECEKILRSRIRKPRKDTMKRISQQAERTAWKLIFDWVDVQMTMIELNQAEFMQVFMPYLYDHSTKQTYFEKMKEKGLQKLLPALTEKG